MRWPRCIVFNLSPAEVFRCACRVVKTCTGGVHSGKWNHHTLGPQGGVLCSKISLPLSAITIGFLFLLACVVNLRSKVFLQQKALDRLSQDVADLRLAEGRRFLAELKYPNVNNLRIEGASAEDRQLDVASSPPIQIREDSLAARTTTQDVRPAAMKSPGRVVARGRG